MKNRRLTKIILINGVSLLLLFAALIAAACLRAMPRSQSAAKLWRGESEERFAQVSCFFPEAGAADEEALLSFRRKLDTKLVEASLEAPEGGSLLTHAYSAKAELVAASDSASSDVTAFGVEGDYFLFHPLRLRSGSYLTSDALMRDLVVLNEELAWKLFGSYDIAGMTVTLGQSEYIVAGVAAIEDDAATRAAHPGGSCVFMYYSALLKELPDTGVTCYELVMPDPVSGFARDIVAEAFPDAEVVQNTGRFDRRASWALLGSFAKRSMQSAGMSFPYWENAARFIEDWLALLLVLTLLFCVCPAVTAVCLAVSLLRRLKRGAGRVKGLLLKLAEKRRTRGYAPRPEGEESSAPSDEPEPPAEPSDDVELDVAAIVREVLDDGC